MLPGAALRLPAPVFSQTLPAQIRSPLFGCDCPICTGITIASAPPRAPAAAGDRFLQVRLTTFPNLITALLSVRLLSRYLHHSSCCCVHERSLQRVPIFCISDKHYIIPEEACKDQSGKVLSAIF